MYNSAFVDLFHGDFPIWEVSFLSVGVLTNVN